MIKGFRQIAIITMFSRVLGLLRESAFAYFIGAGGLMDGWVIAFKIPNLSRRIFGEGAAASSLIPIYSEQLHKDPKAANRLAQTVVTTVFLLLTAVVIVGETGIWIYYANFAHLPETRHMLQLTALMLPYMVMICVVALLAGLLQTHRHFAMPAAAPLVLNVFMIGALCISGWVFGLEPHRQVYIVAGAVILAGLVQWGMQLPFLHARGVRLLPRLDFKAPEFHRIIVLMGPMILGLTATQINTLADDFIAKCLSGSDQKGVSFLFFGREVFYPVWEGAVSYLHYSQRLYQFPLGVLGISLATAIFPVMSEAAARQDRPKLVETICNGLRCAMYISLPAIVGLLLIRTPLVQAIYQRGRFELSDTQMTSRTLMFYALGLWGFFSQQIVTRAYYSLKDSKMPAVTAFWAVCLNITLNLILIWPMGTAGLALSTALCSYVQVAILLSMLYRQYGRGILACLGRDFLKTALASAVMGAAGWYVLRLCSGIGEGLTADLIRIGSVVLVCVGVFMVASRVLKIEMLGLILGSRKRSSARP